MNFFDTDEEIETRTGASIDWIFDLEGEDGFRKRESAMLAEMVDKNSIVLYSQTKIYILFSRKMKYQRVNPWCSFYPSPLASRIK